MKIKSILKTLPITFIILALLCGCNAIYKTAVTLTQAEDAIMKQWATLHNDGKTTADIDVKVQVAHANFNKAKLAAAVALRAYDAGGDKANYVRLLEAARAAIDPILEILQPLLAPKTVESLNQNVMNAKTP